MDPFVHRLVERLLDTSKPLSRNRHFHTFETPEGKRAMRITRRLLALQRDIRACRDDGGRSRVGQQTLDDGEVQVEVRLEHLKTLRTTLLDPSEYELLLRLPEMREALASAASS